MAEGKFFNLDQLQVLQNLTLGTNHVTRWQGTPQVLPYNVSTHAYNCAMLYLQLSAVINVQPNLPLLTAILCHDNMEALTGDVLAPAKDAVEDSWDQIEEEVQQKFIRETGSSALDAIHFLPTETDFDMNLTPNEKRLLKIIDMLEFLLHAQQEYRAGNSNHKIMQGLRYGGRSLKNRLKVDHEPDFVFDSYCLVVRAYYNRQIAELRLGEDFYV